jgi:hypothetical protein
VEKWTTRATPLSSEIGFFGKLKFKKERSPGNPRGCGVISRTARAIPVR